MVVYKTIKIPEAELKKVFESRRLLLLKGINKLKPKLRDAIQEEIKDFDKLTIGIIVGIGAKLLIQELEDGK